MAVSFKTVRSHVEGLLGEYLNADGVSLADSRTVSIRAGTAVFRVRLIENDPPVLLFWATMLTDIDKSPKLLERLNDINAQLGFGRLFWKDGTVVAALSLLAATLHYEEIQNACEAIGEMADRYDVELRAEFGGKLPQDG